LSRTRFGTDGVRGVANSDLTPELALGLGRAAARMLKAPAFVVGRDTRRSGPMLQAAFAAGVAAEGVDVIDAGVIPTPGMAFLSHLRGLPAAMVSASHNPFEDNGIKLFAAGGSKLSPETEESIEAELDLLISGRSGRDPDSCADRVGERVGQISNDHEAEQRYAEHLFGVLEGRRLEGLHVVLDCANGAASSVAPSVFASLGARVTVISNEPDGVNINAGCGSTAPGSLIAKVLEEEADLGLAFDGDADRLVAVDHAGAVADGDVLLALFAVHLQEQGNLERDTVVVTVMTNLGFRLAMARREITVLETQVGDRFVLNALEADGFTLGGEQSGHIVFRHLATTGDGILTGLVLADLILRSGRSLADLSRGLIERVPQVLVNVPVADPGSLAVAEGVWAAVAAVEERLGQSGRVLLRASGTEPVVRVMVEAADEGAAAEEAEWLCKVVESSLGETATLPEQAGRRSGTAR